MAKRAAGPDDEFLTTDFDTAKSYMEKHPEYALCRVRHDVSFHRPPVDMVYHPDGTYAHIYVCGGCTSEYHRRYWPDGRYHSGKWVYAEGYIAEKGTGYSLISRSGKAAFNLALNEIMSERMQAAAAKPRRKR